MHGEECCEQIAYLIFKCFPSFQSENFTLFDGNQLGYIETLVIETGLNIGFRTKLTNRGKTKVNSDILSYNRYALLSSLLFMSVREHAIVIQMWGLTLGIGVPGDALHNTLSPPSFQIERFKIYKLTKIQYFNAN